MQIWVPDTRAPGFAADVRGRRERVNEADRAEHLMEWIKLVGVFDEDDVR